jgi:phosphatidylserine/phosphatidylglycerophosphate/cardiolipin synthase-like enzyme
MMQRAIDQWQRDGRAEWKAPLFHRLEQAGVVHRKPSRPYAPGTPRNHMHAKVLVCDDVTIVGSYNCSHSGEFNAENVVELRGGPVADRCTTFVDDVFATYPSASHR